MDDARLIPLLPDLAVFAQVVDAAGFSAAARRLGVTPSAVSRQVQRLERALSVRLIERSTRRLRVTEAGREVYHRCREMALAASAAVDAAGRLQAAPRGLVRLSAPVAYARSLIHPLVPAFLESHPQVQLQVLLLDRHTDPIAEELDVVIRLTDRPFEGWAARPLRGVRHLLCASPAYLQAHGTPLRPGELAQHQCVYLGENREDHRWRFQRQDERAAVSVQGRYIANHSGVRLDAALWGLGIASLPDFVAQAPLAEGRLVQVLEDWQFLAPAYAGTAWLMYPPNRYLPPKVRVLVDFLADRLGVRGD